MMSRHGGVFVLRTVNSLLCCCFPDSLSNFPQQQKVIMEVCTMCLSGLTQHIVLAGLIMFGALLDGGLLSVLFSS